MEYDPPPPYSSIDESKGAGYPQRDYYPSAPPPSNRYGATSYPAAAGYYGDPRPGPGAARPFYPGTAEPAPPPRVVVAPAGTVFTRFGGVQQSLRQRYSTYSTHILLSCIVICCCGPGGFVCGLLAFCVAVVAQSFAESSPQMSRQLGRASLTLSLAGIAVTLLTVAIVVANGGFYVHPRNGTATGNSTVDDYYCLYPVGNRCFNSRQRVRSMRFCYDGYYLNRYCYRKEQMI